MLNRVILIGRLVRDPDLKYSTTGTAICSFTLAVDNPFKKEDPKADFIPIVTFQKTAEASASYLKKGKLVAVEGRIQTRNYENNEGRKIYVTEVIADNVRFLESSKSGEGGQQADRQADRAMTDPFADDGKVIDISEDDLPF